MFALSDLKESRVYQEGKTEGKIEGKIETVPLLFKLGLTPEKIAKELSLELEVVHRALPQGVQSKFKGKGQSKPKQRVKE